MCLGSGSTDLMAPELLPCIAHSPCPLQSQYHYCPVPHRTQLVSISPSAALFCACTVALSISNTFMATGQRSRHARVSKPDATLISCGGQD